MGHSTSESCLPEVFRLLSFWGFVACYFRMWRFLTWLLLASNASLGSAGWSSRGKGSTRAISLGSLQAGPTTLAVERVNTRGMAPTTLRTKLWLCTCWKGSAVQNLPLSVIVAAVTADDAAAPADQSLASLAAVITNFESSEPTGSIMRP